MSFARMAGVAGLLAVISLVVNGALLGNQPTLDDPTSEVVAYISEDLDMHRVALLFGAAVLPFYAVFLAGIVSHVRAADQQHGESWAVVALAAGVLLGATATVGDVLIGALILRGGDGLDDSTVRAMWDIGIGAYSATGLAIGTLAGAVAISALRHPRWAPWYGWLSALAAVLGLITIVSTNWTADTAVVLGFIAFGALIVWTLVTSVLLIQESTSAA